MTFRIAEFDPESKLMVERDSTPEEDLQREADLHAAHAAMQARVTLDLTTYMAEVRALRERILNRLAGIAAAAQVAEDTTTLTAFVDARQRLLDITKAPAVAAATTAGEAKLAVKAEYALIVSACPAALRTAILTVDA
jgi:hypothetical protein